MTKTNPDPASVPIPSGPQRGYTPEEKRRRLVARYLHIVAEMVEGGKLRAFDLAWSLSLGDAPQGALVMDSEALVMGPEPEPIEVEDLTQKLREDKTQDTCGNPHCNTCSNRS